jgi:hypothetical protein
VEYKTENTDPSNTINTQEKSSELLLQSIENCGNAKLKFNQSLFKPTLHYKSSSIKEPETDIIDYVEFNPLIKNQNESFAVYCRIYKNVDTEIIKDINDFKKFMPEISSSFLLSQKFEFVVDNNKIKNQISYPTSKYIKEGNKLSISRPL